MDKGKIELQQINDYLWEIPKHGEMRVPGRIYATKDMIEKILLDETPQQVANVACLPGIVKYSLAMPDAHWGYGFPIGGVAAMDLEEGVISPGGVGYDINCGVRLLRTNLTFAEVELRLETLVEELYNTIPTGVGAKGGIGKLSRAEVKELVVKGVDWAIERGYATQADKDRTEEWGRLGGADPDKVSAEAIDRGAHQVGTLGSGNHFLEVDRVEEIFLPEIAEKLGLRLGGIVVIIHSGSRGFGYQICEDYLKVMAKAMERYQIRLPDKQLACAPLHSPEGKDYLAAMACAANFAWVNRQSMMYLTKKSFQKALGISEQALGMSLIYDVCHNIAKFEEHDVDGQKKRLCVHRKGATRAFPPGHPQIPPVYHDIGQPVLVPGDMGTASYLLVGAPGSMEQTFGSTCHGAGRMMSRAKSQKESRGRDLVKELRQQGVIVRYTGRRTLAEEMPHAYKNVGEVVDVMEGAGISLKVARFKPIGVIKG